MHPTLEQINGQLLLWHRPPAHTGILSRTSSLAEEHTAEQGETLQRLSPRYVDAFSIRPPGSYRSAGGPCPEPRRLSIPEEA